MFPKSIFGHRESKERGEKKGRIEGGDKAGVGTTADSLSLLTPAHLLSHWPAQLSPHSGARPAPASSFLCFAPLIHWNTQWRAHQTPRAVPGPQALPRAAFKGNHEGTEI